MRPYLYLYKHTVIGGEYIWCEWGSSLSFIRRVRVEPDDYFRYWCNCCHVVLKGKKRNYDMQFVDTDGYIIDIDAPSSRSIERYLVCDNPNPGCPCRAHRSGSWRRGKNRIGPGHR